MACELSTHSEVKCSQSSAPTPYRDLPMSCPSRLKEGEPWGCCEHPAPALGSGVEDGVCSRHWTFAMWLVVPQPYWPLCDIRDIKHIQLLEESHHCGYVSRDNKVGQGLCFNFLPKWPSTAHPHAAKTQSRVYPSILTTGDSPWPMLSPSLGQPCWDFELALPKTMPRG